MPAATSEPKVSTSTTSATATPIASVEPDLGLGHERLAARGDGPARGRGRRRAPRMPCAAPAVSGVGRLLELHRDQRVAAVLADRLGVVGARPRRRHRGAVAASATMPGTVAWLCARRRRSALGGADDHGAGGTAGLRELAGQRVQRPLRLGAGDGDAGGGGGADREHRGDEGTEQQQPHGRRRRRDDGSRGVRSGTEGWPSMVLPVQVGRPGRSTRTKLVDRLGSNKPIG